MPKIIECVPNFSEGNDEKVINAISDAIRATAGVRLLDVDPGKSTNRTVYTFVGSPQTVVEGALNAARAAYPLIDMRQHKGEHPRMGALDVCPFIPVSDVSVEECVAVAKVFGERLAKELAVPVFLYGSASSQAYRSTMPQIRAGEYEGLEEKLKKPEWKPDFGEAVFAPTWGGTVTGVRKFLIAYNINMLSTKEQAHRIALNLREKGRSDSQPGRLKACQGIGWWLEEANIAQISLNLTDMDVTPMHVAYEEAKKDATELGLAVTGSELVGLVPLQALLSAADFYIEKEGLMVLEEDQKVHLAINRMGLSTLSPFNAKERIIEYCLGNSGKDLLVEQTVADFVKSVGARTPAPGGGSVAALVGALGCGLAAMVGKLTYGKRQWEHLDKDMRGILPGLHNTMLSVTDMVDKDTEAFNDFFAAMKLPKQTDEQVAHRDNQMQKAIVTAIQVPMGLAMTLNSVWEKLELVAKVGNVNCKSDVQVAARCIETGVHGAVHNVETNLSDLTDLTLKQELQDQATTHAKTATTKRDQILDILATRKQ